MVTRLTDVWFVQQFGIANGIPWRRSEKSAFFFFSSNDAGWLD